MKRPTKLMNSVEAHCESILADLLSILPVNGTRISVKYNWTWRKVTSRKSSSRSELYSGRFQRFENVDLETRGIEISLHLARYVKSDIDMNKANRVWIENSSFGKQRDIGHYAPATTWDVLSCLVAHETAHAIVEGNMSNGGGKSHGHGAIWKSQYRTFRNHLGLIRDWTWNRDNAAQLLGEEATALIFDVPGGGGGHCDVCGKAFFKQRGRKTKTGHTVCSPKCRTQAWRDARKNSV